MNKSMRHEIAITLNHETLNKLREIVYLNGESNVSEYDEYVHGVSDGMELVMAYLERREPIFRKSDKGLYRGVRTVREVSYSGFERDNKDVSDLKS